MHPNAWLFLGNLGGSMWKPNFFEGPVCFTWKVRPIGFTRLNWLFLHSLFEKEKLRRLLKLKTSRNWRKICLGLLLVFGQRQSHTACYPQDFNPACFFVIKPDNSHFSSLLWDQSETTLPGRWVKNHTLTYRLVEWDLNPFHYYIT